MITSLFHITHINNLPGILSRGLLCRQQMQDHGMPYQDLSDPGCQSRRTCRKVGAAVVNLHDYVPLFINPHNPMLYRLEKTQQELGRDGSLAILELSADPTHCPASLVSDGIASSSATHLFYATDPAAWEALDWTALRCRSWVDAPQGTGRRLMAEVLVPGLVERLHIRKVWLQNQAKLPPAAERLAQAGTPACQVDRQRQLFFR
jgi:hypothetical protein